MVEAAFSVEAMVRGYRVYKDVWTPTVDDHEELLCAADPFAVTVMKEDTTVGHVLRKISTICSLFLQRFLPIHKASSC